MKQQIADIVTNQKEKLQGFKILGVFPFYLTYITVYTHIQLCKVKEQIQQVVPEGKQGLNQFYDSELQAKIIPLIIDYCAIALTNNRRFKKIFHYILKRQLRKVGHTHILNLYMTIQKLNQPAFFLTYWNWMTATENTLLKEGSPSLES